MIFLYFGTDTLAARTAAFKKVHEHIESGVSVTQLDAGSYAPGSLSDLAGATSLFGGVEVVLIDTPEESAEFKAEVESLAHELADSSNHFLIITGALKAPEKRTWQKHTDELEEFSKAAAERQNPFVLAEALARKDKKSLWLGLQQLQRAGLSEEELIGTLWWQLKAMRLASKTSSAAEAGMKDYPYRKAKGALRNFQPGEVDALAQSLLTLYHEGHHGKRELDIGLERFVLTI